MSFNITKEFDGNYSIAIEPDDDYEYICVESKRFGMFFIQIDKNNKGRIITIKGIDTKSYDMNDFCTYSDNRITKIKQRFEATLPSKEKYFAELN